MIVRFLGSFVFFWLVMLGYIGVNSWVLFGTLLWNHRIYRNFWPKWGLNKFFKDILEAVEAPWES